MYNDFFSYTEELVVPPLGNIPSEYFNEKLKMDGRDLLKMIPDDSIPIVFFDPQYRGVLDKLSYGNEGESRGKDRSNLDQMSDEIITEFINDIDRILKPSAHLFLWIDKYHLMEGFKHWLKETRLRVVDMIVWDKVKMGMGYRSRRISEYLVIIQKRPTRAKDIWNDHQIKDVWRENLFLKEHTHQKPQGLQSRLIVATSKSNDVIVDPAAGSFSVMKSANNFQRNFLGCDIEFGKKYLTS